MNTNERGCTMTAVWCEVFSILCPTQGQYVETVHVRTFKQIVPLELNSYQESYSMSGQDGFVTGRCLLWVLKIIRESFRYFYLYF